VSDLGSGVALIPENLNAAFQIDGTTIVGYLEYQLKPGQSGGLAIAWQPMTLPRRAEAERPAGQWNEVEIRYDGPKLTFGLNGTVVNQVALEQYWPCNVALLAQGSDVRFRNLRIIPTKQERSAGPASVTAAGPRDPALPPDGRPFRLVNVKSGKALDVKDASTRNDAALMQAKQADRPSQLWALRTVNGRQVILNANSGLSIHIRNVSSLNKHPLIQWKFADGKPQECWFFSKQAKGYRITSQKSNLVIAAPANPDADGPIVQLFPRGGDEELWQVVPAKP